MDNNLYKYPMALTQQFKHCGNPFRIDTYKGCDFGCKYCFANNRGGNFNNNFKIADFDVIKKYFEKAFDNADKEYKNITVEMLRHKVPLHLGGMSDPFQKREAVYRNTFKLIELTSKYNYPMMISTKTSGLSKEYFDILNPDIHAFQISLISLDDQFIKSYESNTPSPLDRIKLIEELKSKNFWVSLRLQPLVNIEHAIKLVERLSGIVDYITVEHIKIGNDSKNKVELFKLFNLTPQDFVSSGREYELKTDIKRKNIDILKSISKCPIGCGDNDLHELSCSNNCCGIDTINENFSNWIKYNEMYIKKTGDVSAWYPKCNCSSCVNNEGRVKGWFYKDYVDAYINSDRKVGKCKVEI